MRARGQTWLEPVVKFATVIEEFGNEWSVLPVDVFLFNAPLKAFSDLGSCQWPIEECGGPLHFILKLLVLFVNVVATCVVAIGFDLRSSFSVFLLVLPDGRHHVIFTLVLEVWFYSTQWGVQTDVLAKSFLDDAVRREVFIRVDQHFSGGLASFDELIEGVIAKLYTLVRIIK